ncbi:MAG: acyl-CoA dehydrogenase family protein [Dehalococcoidia bacterium]|nr:acyl-CoA dehydrogenase family protein [Dehalococcoidia bacterium]
MADSIRKGGSFFLEDVPPEEVFTPEDLGGDHEMLVRTTERFVKIEVMPHLEELEHKDFVLCRSLMRQAGELGLLGADIDEEFGGSEMGMVASHLIIEHSAQAASFGVTLNVHTGIGSMPLVFFGNRAQKQKYLPSLASGQAIGAYALTEPGAGTDALSLQSTARLSPDGEYYILDGTKQFITNGGIADIIFTYAKVDGGKLTAFILERDFPGVSTGPEEKKMGIRGTSTCCIFLDGAKVPKENVLFQIGRGHIVAFNILNLGRFKVASGCLGMAKQAIESSVGYTKERVQFGKPVCQFGLMKHKIAEMAARTYMAESMLYRTAGLIDTVLGGVDRNAEDAGEQSAKSIAEYAIECSINKVYCSEMLAYVADEAVQMYGGYGYIEDYPVERIYRDCKIFRIYEGTNEINRTIMTGWIMRKAQKQELPLMPLAAQVREELSGLKSLNQPAGGLLEAEREIVSRAKKLLILLCGAAAARYGAAIEDEQDILGPLSDIVMEVYAMDSGLLRAVKSMRTSGEQRSETKVDMVRLYVNQGIFKVLGLARQVLATMTPEQELETELSAMDKLAGSRPVNTTELKRRIADEIIEVGKYTC